MQKLKDKCKEFIARLSGAIGFLVLICLALSVFAAWFTHIYSTVKLGHYAFLALGLIIPFIGIIHGYLVWLGIV